MHRHLIELYALSGDRLAALRQYETCITVLERELGVDPLPETREVYRTVLEGNQPGPANAHRPTWTTLPGLNVPFVGRQDALRLLDKALSRARHGHGGVLWITGEPGIGKTRLLQEFASRHEGNAYLLVGNASANMQTYPYHALVQALRPALQDPAVRRRVAPHWLAEVLRSLPEMDADAQTTGARDLTDRRHLFEALRQVMLSLASSPEPIILCLDDLQWSDHPTLEWLAYLAQSLSGSPILVAASCCSPEAGRLEPLRRQLWRLGCLTEIPLAGLESGEIVQILYQVASPSAGVQHIAERLLEATGGNPFFVLEILRERLESGRLPENLPDLDELTLPASVKQAVESHLEHLSPVAAQVLQAVSVLHPPLNFDSLVITTGRSEQEVVDALDELVSRQFLVMEHHGDTPASQDRPHRYQFLHRIVRSVVYNGMSPWRRQLLHQRAAQATQALQPSDPAALVWHYQHANLPGMAAIYALQAGESACAAYAPSQARDYFSTAISCLEAELPNLFGEANIANNRKLLIQAFVGRCWTHHLQGEMSRYEEDLHYAIRAAEALHDQAILASLCWRQACVQRWFCRFSEALQAAQEGTELCHLSADARAEAFCWRELGLAAGAMGSYMTAELAIQQALDGFIRLNEAAYQIHTLGNLSNLYLMIGDAPRARSLALQALEQCEQAELHFEKRIPLGDLGAADLALGEMNAAHASLEECLQLSRQVGDRSQEIFALRHLGQLMSRSASPGDALSKLRIALDLAEKIGSQIEQPGLLADMAEIYQQIGQVEQARQYVGQSVRVAERIGLATDLERARRLAVALAELHSLPQ